MYKLYFLNRHIQIKEALLFDKNIIKAQKFLLFSYESILKLFHILMITVSPSL